MISRLFVVESDTLRFVFVDNRELIRRTGWRLVLPIDKPEILIIYKQKEKEV